MEGPSVSVHTVDALSVLPPPPSLSLSCYLLVSLEAGFPLYRFLRFATKAHVWPNISSPTRGHCNIIGVTLMSFFVNSPNGGRSCASIGAFLRSALYNCRTVRIIEWQIWRGASGFNSCHAGGRYLVAGSVPHCAGGAGTGSSAAVDTYTAVVIMASVRCRHGCVPVSQGAVVSEGPHRGQPGGAVQQLQRRRLPRKLLRHGRQALGHGVQARR